MDAVDRLYQRLLSEIEGVDQKLERALLEGAQIRGELGRLGGLEKAVEDLRRELGALKDAASATKALVDTSGQLRAVELKAYEKAEEDKETRLRDLEKWKERSVGALAAWGGLGGIGAAILTTFLIRAFGWG